MKKIQFDGIGVFVAQAKRALAACFVGATALAAVPAFAATDTWSGSASTN